MIIRGVWSTRTFRKSKNIIFEGEDNWDLKFKSYEELITAYELQSALPEPVFMEAIENTNLLLDLIEEFQLDTNTKYPPPRHPTTLMSITAQVIHRLFFSFIPFPHIPYSLQISGSSSFL